MKHLWKLDDGEQVESVLIPTVDRLTLCLSSQAGCALGCRFCATGYFGFRRQLRSAEIVAQYRESARLGRHPLPELMEAVRRYQAARGRRVSFEYTLIRGINDAPELAEALADLLADLTCFVNLILFNPIPDRPEWGPSPPDRRGISAAVREPRGRDIAAACGQLRLERAAAG